MFAVPGWSVPASLLKTQSELSTGGSSNERNKSGKKRKLEKSSAESSTEAQSHKRIETDTPVDAKSIDSAADHGSSKDKTIRNESKKTKHDSKRAKTEGSKSSKEVRSHGKKDRQTGSTDNHQSAMDNQKPVKPSPTTKLESMQVLTPLQSAMRQKLVSARFRHLNQTLYTTPSSDAEALLEENPTFFDEYHEGFRQQVASWPENPVDRYTQEVLSRGRIRDKDKQTKGAPNQSIKPSDVESSKALPRTRGHCAIADLGCGDAKLAQQLEPMAKKLNITVTSYDLASNNALVTKADIAHLPARSGSFDVAIFCLALMGTNWVDFIDEAWRVLRWKGELWVSEIKSRFAPSKRRQVVSHSVGYARKGKRGPTQEQTAENTRQIEQELAVEVDGVEDRPGTDVSRFTNLMRSRGFHLADGDAIDMNNKMFVMMRFVKNVQPFKGKNMLEGGTGQKPKFLDAVNSSRGTGVDQEDESEEGSILKPCLYKLR